MCVKLHFGGGVGGLDCSDITSETSDFLADALYDAGVFGSGGGLGGRDGSEIVSAGPLCFSGGILGGLDWSEMVSDLSADASFCVGIGGIFGLSNSLLKSIGVGGSLFLGGVGGLVDAFDSESKPSSSSGTWLLRCMSFSAITVRGFCSMAEMRRPFWVAVSLAFPVMACADIRLMGSARASISGNGVIPSVV